MTAPLFNDVPRPLVDAQTAADLFDEADFLSRMLRQPAVRTPGAAGILNRVAQSTGWIVGDVCVDELDHEIAACEPHPDVMIPATEVALAETFHRRGWVVGHVVERLQRDLPGATRTVVSRDASVAVRPARPADLPRLRALHVQAFGDEASADYLPDSVLEVPGLEIFVAESSDDQQQLMGTAGIRLRHDGALLFGLATAIDERRRGVATLVVAECLEWAVRQCTSYVLADVDTPAPVLWQRLGFHVASRWRRCSRPE